MAQLEDEGDVGCVRDHMPEGGGGWQEQRKELSDKPRTRHLSRASHRRVGLDLALRKAGRIRAALPELPVHGKSLKPGEGISPRRTCVRCRRATQDGAERKPQVVFHCRWQEENQ